MANFSLYKQYCDKHTEAWSLLSIYRNRSEWAQFTKECVSQDIGEERRLHFEDYLIKVNWHSLYILCISYYTHH